MEMTVLTARNAIYQGNEARLGMSFVKSGIGCRWKYDRSVTLYIHLIHVVEMSAVYHYFYY